MKAVDEGVPTYGVGTQKSGGDAGRNDPLKNATCRLGVSPCCRRHCCCDDATDGLSAPPLHLQGQQLYARSSATVGKTLETRTFSSFRAWE